MEYRRVGNSGLSVSTISVGGWLTFGNTVDMDTTREIIREAVDRGVNSVDLADVYAKGEAERFIGQALRDYRRCDLVISSKVFWPVTNSPNGHGLGRKHIMESIDQSLKNLGTDYVDLYYCHRSDSEVPIEETVCAMDDLIHQGKVLYWGTSMWHPKLMRRVHRFTRRHGLYAPIVEQPEYSLLHRWMEKRVLSTARKLHVGLMVWGPLAGGILSGKYQNGTPDGSRGSCTTALHKDLTAKTLEKVGKFCKLAETLALRPAQLAIAWLLQRPEVTSVITGATSPQQLACNVGAVDIKINPEVDKQLRALFPI